MNRKSHRADTVKITILWRHQQGCVAVIGHRGSRDATPPCVFCNAQTRSIPVMRTRNAKSPGGQAPGLLRDDPAGHAKNN